MITRKNVVMLYSVAEKSDPLICSIFVKKLSILNMSYLNVEEALDVLMRWHWCAIYVVTNCA